MNKLKPLDFEVAGFTFKRLGFDSFDLYAHYFRNASYEDMTFYGSFPLMMRRRFGFKIIDGYLAIFRFIRKETGLRIDCIGLPINEKGERLDVANTRKCLEMFNSSFDSPGRGRITHLHPALNARYPYPELAPSEKLNVLEYVYNNDLLAGLQGGEFRNLRKAFNNFANHHSVEIVPYEKKFREDADRLYLKWCAGEGAKYAGVWDNKLFANLLDNYGVIDHHLFMVIEKSSGACIGLFDAVRINPQFAIGVMRKLDTGYENIAVYCQVFLARYLAEKACTFLNDGDDAGRPGLKYLKSRFHPVSTFTPLHYQF